MLGKRVTPLLKSRIDKAVEASPVSQSNVKIIASGGQVGDEEDSRTQAICTWYLLERRMFREKRFS